MTKTSTVAKRSVEIRWGNGRILMEAVALALLIGPPAWLALHWLEIPTISPHLHHHRMFLWVMPAFAVAVYLEAVS